MTGRSFRRDEEGQAIFVVAIVFLALVFIVALVVNVGQLFTARRAAQQAADAAALAGAVANFISGADADILAAAQGGAVLNGYKNLTTTPAINQTGDVVTVNHPPKSGVFASDSRYVEVLIDQTIGATLVPQWGLTGVHVRAVAGLVSGRASGDAIISMDKGSTKDGFKIANNGTLDVVSGALQVNSSHPTEAAFNQGSGNITMECKQPVPPPPSPVPCEIDVNGSVRGPWPPGTGGQPQVNDPFSPYPKPVPVANTNWCRRADAGQCSQNFQNFNTCGGGTQYLDPGIYTGSISGNCTWVLNPGVFVFVGNSAGISNPDGIQSCGDAPLLPCRSTSNGQPFNSPGGNLLFFTYLQYPNTLTQTGDCASLLLSGKGKNQLAAEASGTWTGFLVYFDTGYCDQRGTLTFNGGSTTSAFRGLIYAPTNDLTVKGNGSTGKLALLIARTIDIGNGSLVVDLNSALVRPRGRPRLAE